jgi:hypothetical protein
MRYPKKATRELQLKKLEREEKILKEELAFLAKKEKVANLKKKAFNKKYGNIFKNFKGFSKSIQSSKL